MASVKDNKQAALFAIFNPEEFIRGLHDDIELARVKPAAVVHSAIIAAIKAAAKCGFDSISLNDLWKEVKRSIEAAGLSSCSAANRIFVEQVTDLIARRVGFHLKRNVETGDDSELSWAK